MARQKESRAGSQAQNQQLEASLQTGATTIQKEYDNFFGKLGRRFAVGDERGKSELNRYIIQLQQTIISLLAEDAGAAALVMPHFPLILSTSEDTRSGVVQVLSEQYQRLTQAKSLNSVFRSLFGSTATGNKTKYPPMPRQCRVLSLEGDIHGYRGKPFAECKCGFQADEEDIRKASIRLSKGSHEYISLSCALLQYHEVGDQFGVYATMFYCKIGLVDDCKLWFRSVDELRNHIIRHHCDGGYLQMEWYKDFRLFSP